MKRLVVILILITTTAFSQDKYITRSGSLTFEASVPSFEEVVARHDAVTAIINAENGEIAALALVKGFRFKNALMEEHFNENYAESDTYPKAIFKGKVNKLENLKPNDEFETDISGSLTFHGVTQEYEAIPVKIRRTENAFTIQGSFIAKVSDFGIDIPKIVRKKLSEEVDVVFNYTLEKASTN